MSFLTKWASKKLNNVVQTAVVEPVKQDIREAKDNASDKIGLVTNIIRFILCFGIGFVMLKDHADDDTVSSRTMKKSEPTTIVINNYINEGGQRYDNGKPYQHQKSGQPR